MRLHSLRLENFRQHLDTYIEFDRGLTGIIGPNGSGKSTIFEAIAWALYGTKAARPPKESIRAHRAPPRSSVSVELDFELGAHRYRVVRGLTSAEVYLDGGESPIANSITGVTELLRRRLGMSLDEFFNTYFTGQKELSVMSAMGASERAQFLSRVLGYERLRTAQVMVRDQRKLIIAEAVGLKSGMADPDVVARSFAEGTERVATARVRAQEATARNAAARDALAALMPRWEALQEERELVQEIGAQLRVLEGEETALLRDTARIERERVAINVAREELERLRAELAPIELLRVQVSELERLAREDGRRQALLDADRVLGEELTRMRERRTLIATAPQLEEESITELEQRRADLELAEGRLEVARTEWVRDRQEADTKVEQLKAQLLDHRAQREHLVQLGEEGTCPMCARPLGDHFREVLDGIDEQIETVTAEGRYYRARIEQLKAMPPEVAALDLRRRELFEAVGKLERRLAKVQLAVQELIALDRDLVAKDRRRAAMAIDLERVPGGYDAGLHAVARAELERLVPLESRVTRLGATLEREPALATELATIEARLAAIRATLAVFGERRGKLTFSEEAFAEMRGQVESAAATLRTAELAAVAADGEIANAKAALESVERVRADLARTEARLATLSRDKRLHDELDRAYTDMRTELNLQLRPEISDLASRFLSELTDGRYSELELDEAYNVTVLEDGIPKPVISGGEEDLANLVLRLAISQMIAERAGQPLSLLILDEVFGSLDEFRRHNVVDLLRRLQDRFEQVILITHIESVREGLDRIITVRYDDESGVARVEQDASTVEAPLLELHVGAAD